MAIDHFPTRPPLLPGLLERAGYRVTVRTRAADALAEIVVLAPDMLIGDFMVRTMVDDWSFLLRLPLDRRTAAIPVVLCTDAGPEVEVLGEQLAAMKATVLCRPLRREAVIRAVAEGLLRPVMPLDA